MQEDNQNEGNALFEAKSMIVRHHSDETVRKLRNTFGRPSLFDIAKMSRNENMHSAFIVWLLSENPSGIPLRGLLNIMIRRSMNQNIDIPNHFLQARHSPLTMRKLSIL